MTGAVYHIKSNIIWRNTCDKRFRKRQLIRGLLNNCFFLVGRLPILGSQRDLEDMAALDSGLHKHTNMPRPNAPSFCLILLSRAEIPPEISLCRAYIKSLEERLGCCSEDHLWEFSPQTCSREERRLLSKRVLI